MAVYRQVHISFWQDPFIIELTPEEKYFYLYLMTNSKTKQCGCYEISKRVMVLETGYNSETIEKLLNKFVDYGKVEYNDKTNEILLKNWLHYNSYKSPKVLYCIEGEVKEIKHKPFAEYLADRLSIDYTYTMHTETQKEEEEEKEKEETVRFTPPAISEIRDYCNERSNNINAEQFHDFYSAKGWMVGKNKMKDWRAAVRTWERRDGGDKGKEVYL
jgi:hypothetical protein